VPREQLPFSKRGGPYSSRRCFIAERKALRGLLVAANQDPRLASVFSTFSATNPSLYLDIDRDKAQVLGVDISSIFQALQASLGSYYVNDMNLFGRTWQVQGQAEAEDRASVDDIYRIHVRNSKGEMIPLRSLVETRVVVGPQGWPSPSRGAPHLNDGSARALRAEAEAKEANSRAERKLGLARRADNRAQALHDAARRAAGESLDLRLERVLPLMSELYRRLRPHPIWGDIEYKIRGDVRRFLKLQVGNELNPQFIFSSGQRRATGLAFLLSVNLSLAWSKWRTILLDDPVQHIDDFRSIQLTEVVAQLLAGGRQIICAVEDAALADLLCRRLPIDRQGDGKRVTLGPAPDGSLTKLKEFELAPLPQHSLVTGPQRLAV
jgi:hypothetical protein